jgi:hypothetical protein
LFLKRPRSNHCRRFYSKRSNPRRHAAEAAVADVAFDTTFTQRPQWTNFTKGLQWLPPDTPSLRSLNTMHFTQQIMPTQ